LNIEDLVGGVISAIPSGPYYLGDVVYLEAISAPGYAFTGRTGGLSDSPYPTSITNPGAN